MNKHPLFKCNDCKKQVDGKYRKLSKKEFKNIENEISIISVRQMRN